MNGLVEFLATCALGGLIVLAYAAVVVVTGWWQRQRATSPLTFPAWVWFEIRLWALAAAAPFLPRVQRANQQTTELVERESEKAWAKRGRSGGVR